MLNKNLLEQAQALFVSWFVDYEPFGGNMPDDWENISVYGLADYINGAAFKKNEYADTGVPIIKIAELKNGITDSTQRCYVTKDEKYYIVTDRWQTFTNVELNTDILEKLSGYCDEFLVHGVDVEGKASGIEEELIKILEQAEIPVTYAGGIGSLDDLERIRKIGNGKIDFTIGSALDLFGGKIPYDVIKNYR